MDKAMVDERRLVASLLEHGQQTPVLVVRDEAAWVLIDGYVRVEALGKLARDLVEAAVLEMAEAEALVPLARANAAQCEQLVCELDGEPVTVRQMERLYVAWKAGDAEQRQRLAEQGDGPVTERARRARREAWA